MANEQTTTISALQLEQALQTIATAVKWSEPPRSDTVAPGDRHAANAQAFELVVMCARQAMKQQTPTDTPDITPYAGSELADVSTNGDS